MFNKKIILIIASLSCSSVRPDNTFTYCIKGLTPYALAAVIGYGVNKYLEKSPDQLRAAAQIAIEHKLMHDQAKELDISRSSTEYSWPKDQLVGEFNKHIMKFDVGTRAEILKAINDPEYFKALQRITRANDDQLKLVNKRTTMLGTLTASAFWGNLYYLCTVPRLVLENPLSIIRTPPSKPEYIIDLLRGTAY